MKKITLTILLLLALLSCSQPDSVTPDSSITVSPNGTATNEWLIPQSKVFDGGPGIDGIPSVDQPKFEHPDHPAHDYLNDDSRVLVYRSDNIIKAYPHPILDWHEIVNDQIGEDSIALTYCPLTGTGIGWGRIINGNRTTFGVSGLLYESNLMPYDRSTNSTWSQLFNQCVNGALIRTAPPFFNFVEINFAALKKLYPQAQGLQIPVLTATTKIILTVTTLPVTILFFQ